MKICEKHQAFEAIE